MRTVECSTMERSVAGAAPSLSAYTELVQHVAEFYGCDPQALIVSLASLGHQLPQQHIHTGSSLSKMHSDDANTSKQEVQDLSARNARNTTEKINNNLLNARNENVFSEHQTIAQDNDGALDLSTQGLKALYSPCRRTTLDKIKPKIVEDNWVENDCHLSWIDSKVAAYNPAQKLFMCVECECVGFLSRVAEHWLGAHANLRVFRCPRCPYTSAWSRCVKMHLTRQHNEQCADTTMWKENATLLEVTKLMQQLRTKVETKIDSSNVLTDKRFYCPHCPYATDRRDLYTRHENIHKDDKPFHCYICYKQFNRADHVKKHFTRMHPDTDYDITKIRKQPGLRVRSSNVAREAEANSSTPSLPPLTHMQDVAAADKVINSCQTVTNVSDETFNTENSNDDASLREESAQQAANNLRENIPTVNYVDSLSPLSPEISVVDDDTEPDLRKVPQAKNPFVKVGTRIITNSDDNSKDKPKSEKTCDSLKPGKIKVNLDNMNNDVSKKKRHERALRCPYCQWSGSDNWCLKRHMNTHTKPFACCLCEYKAARAERLSTHVFKVHNKRICSKCNFMAATQELLLEHTREAHHNNPYNKRHSCGVCSLSLENQTAEETHLDEKQRQQMANKLSDKRTPIFVGQFLLCPNISCSAKFSHGNDMLTHIHKAHSDQNLARCPHCGYCLSEDDRAKEHWTIHHKDVCNVCIHTFTIFYGAQLWKQVNGQMNTQENSDGSLDCIVNGLCRKRAAPTNVDLTPFEEANCDVLPSDCPEYDFDRQCKRSRKQSCPKKVISLLHFDTKHCSVVNCNHKLECKEENSKLSNKEETDRKEFNAEGCYERINYASKTIYNKRVEKRIRHPEKRRTRRALS